VSTKSRKGDAIDNPGFQRSESRATAETLVFYSDAYRGAAYGFDTTRKSGWIAESLAGAPIAGVRLVEPQPLAENALLTVHAATYVDAVRSGMPRALAESSGFPWDPGIWEAVCASNGGAVAAARHALNTRRNAGSLSSGLHHAHRDGGAGFCTFNGLALAARAAIDAGARRVLILDLDAHVGDGTIAIVGSWPEVLHVDIAVSAWHCGGGDPSRSSLDVITHAGDYLPTLEQRLDAVTTADLDLCLYNAGMDLHEDCEIGGLRGLSTEVIRARERMVFEWAAACGVPVAFVLAGGYSGGALTRERLVALHRRTIVEAAMRRRDHSAFRTVMRGVAHRAAERKTFEGCSIDAHGVPQDEAFHSELLGAADDDPFAFEVTDLFLLSPTGQKRFLDERHDQPAPHSECLRLLPRKEADERGRRG
jgi:acetoin utilization deacetylase AcuC-like enzyme